MAYAITANCNACGRCLALCPNHAIVPAARGVRILAWLCTECLGFDEQPRCEAACPEGAAVQLEGAPHAAGPPKHEKRRCRAGSAF